MNIGFLLLCDHSEAVNGKLYLTGGGWNVLRLPELPHEWSFSIGLGIDVAWHETNTPHELVVTVQDPDGNELGEGLTANFETGRPPASRRPGAAPGHVDRRHRRLRHRRPPRRRRPGNGEELGRARFYLMEGVPPTWGWPSDSEIVLAPARRSSES